MSFPVYISRVHANGKLTFCSFFVDLLGTGINDAMYFVNEPRDFYQELIDSYKEFDFNYQKCTYELLHNIIYEALAFADEVGIQPTSEFHFARMVLKEDTDDLPTMDIPLGKNGKHYLDLSSEDPRIEYFRTQMETFAEPGTYIFDDGDEDDEFDDPSFWDEDDWSSYIDQKIDELSIMDHAFRFIYLKYIFNPWLAARQLGTSKPGKEQEFHLVDGLIYEDEVSEEALQINIQLGNEIIEMETPKEAKKMVAKIYKEIERFPENVVLYDLLFVALISAKKPKEATDVYQKTIELFPHHIFAKISYANFLIDEDRHDEVPAVFGCELLFPAVFADRKEIYFSEFLAFHTMAGKYFLKENKLELAFQNLLFINNVDLP